MKKKVLLFVGVFTLTITSAICWLSIHKVLQTGSMSLLTRNIEALADGEEAPTYDCPGGWVECVRIHHGGGESTGFWKE